MKKAVWLTGGAVALTGLAWVREARARVRRREPLEALRDSLPAGAKAFETALHQATGFQLCPGNAVSWCHDAAVFQRIGEAVRAASRSIHIDTYIWKEGAPGEALAQEVLLAAERGVKVRVMVDPVGSEGFEQELCSRLREKGCEVIYFRPPRLKPFKVWGRNHRKLVVVDGKVGFTGGFGIGPEWLGTLEQPGWRDANVRVEGPVVRQMQQAFAAHWVEVGGGLLPAVELEQPEPCGEARAAFVTSTDVKGHSNAHWVTAISLAAARERLWIANAYFVPPPSLVSLLEERARAGVDVRVLLPGKNIDHLWMRLLQRSRYGVLRRRGVRLFEYQPSMMHAKTALVDGRTVVVGSINLDLLSQEVLEEGSLVVDDAKLARELELQWSEDLRCSREVRPAGAEASSRSTA